MLVANQQQSGLSCVESGREVHWAAKIYSMEKLILGNNIFNRFHGRAHFRTYHPSATCFQEAWTPAGREETLQPISTWTELLEVTFEPINMVDRNLTGQAGPYPDLWMSVHYWNTETPVRDHMNSCFMHILHTFEYYVYFWCVMHCKNQRVWTLISYWQN